MVIVDERLAPQADGIATSLAGTRYRCEVMPFGRVLEDEGRPFAMVLSKADPDTLGLFDLIRRRSPRTVAVLCASDLEDAVKAGSAVDAVISSDRVSQDLVGVLEDFRSQSARKHREALTVARALVRGLSIRRVETRDHQERLAVWGRKLALLVGDEELADQVELGAIVHDIGLIGLPDRILQREGSLTAQEWVTVRKHPELGARQLKDVSGLRTAISVVQCHHERWDGTGYPQALKGTQIPLAARVFSVVDALEAITQDRPHRPGAAFGEARRRIYEDAGLAFDPEVVEAFLKFDADYFRKSAQKAVASHWPTF